MTQKVVLQSKIWFALNLLHLVDTYLLEQVQVADHKEDILETFHANLVMDCFLLLRKRQDFDITIIPYIRSLLYMITTTAIRFLLMMNRYLLKHFHQPC